MPGILGIATTDSEAPPRAILAECMRKVLRHSPSYRDYASEFTGCVLGGSTPAYYNAIVQSVSSCDGNCCMVMEGEVFNGDEVRGMLRSDGHYAEATNDAELMMRLYEAYGTNLVQKVNALFILALWDKRERRLTIINDRVGLHLLYYHSDETKLMFGSEMKAILCDPALERRLNPEAVADFFTFGSVFGDRTFLCGVKVMPPGTILRYCRGRVTVEKYWDFPFTTPTNGASKRDYIEEFDRVLRRVFQRQTRDHCRYGIALSGGRDARILAGYLGEAVSPLQTFTFGDPGTDEVSIASRVSQLIGGSHHHIRYSVQEFAASFEKVVWLTEGPINTAEHYQLGKSMAQAVDVGFNGHGGDVLGGRWVTAEIYKARDLTPVKADAFLRYSRRLSAHGSDRLFADQYYPLVEGCARHNFDLSFDKLRAESPLQSQVQHEMNTKNWRDYARVIDVPRLNIRYRYPYFDYEVLDFFLQLPPRMRYHERVYLGVLIQKWPRLADIPYPNRKFSLRAEQTYLRPYYKLRNRVGHYVVDTFHKQLGRFAPSSVIGHNADAYCGFLRDEIYRLLVEGNHRRKYFNADYLEAVLSAHASHEADHSFLLHKLVTFELFNRLFLDPAEPARPSTALL